MSDNCIEPMRQAEMILIPKGKDMQAALDGLATACGIEAPAYQEDRDIRKSQGFTFGYVKGKDIPSWVAQGWADVGVTGTDSCLEYAQQDKIRWQEVGRPMCRYSILVRKAYSKDQLEYWLAEADWNGRSSNPIEVPATRPRTLLDARERSLSTRRRLPFVPLNVPISGSGELAIVLSDVGMGADLVKRGETAKRAGLKEYIKLRDIFAAFVVRSGNEGL